jgi:hypothetical protein
MPRAGADRAPGIRVGDDLAAILAHPDLQLLIGLSQLPTAVLLDERPQPGRTVIRSSSCGPGLG